MKSVVCVMAILTIIGLIVLFVATYINIRNPHTEHFSINGYSTRSLYSQSENFDKDVQNFKTVLADRDQPLLMKRCYQVSGAEILFVLFVDCYMMFGQVTTSRFDDVVMQIKEKLKEFRTEIGQSIKGQVYVLLSQTTYMRDEKNNVIVAQYNVGSYLHSPVNVMNNDDGKQLYEKKLMYVFVIFFTDYKTPNIPRESPFELTKLLKPLESQKSQCFIACMNDSTNSYCGCLNYGGEDEFQSRCAATPRKGDQTEAVPSDFWVLYEINKESSTLMNDRFFND
jgi:hypothetical protein